MRPLEGITVVTLEHAIAAPYCTRHLADLGARVIKIERPGSGDFARHYDNRVRGLSSHFVWTNRSKESVTLDVKKPGGDEVLQRLLQQADVLVQNLAPGAAQRLGLAFATLQERYPKLIVCDISGYGEGGPDSERKAYDLMIQGEAGFLSVTGNETEMAKAGCSIADIAAGMYAYSNILAALLQRARTGKGCHIDISMLEAMTEWMGYPLYYAFEGAEPPARKAATHATICPYGPFPTGDQQQVLLGVQNEREWRVFCEVVLQQPGLICDPRFSSNTLRLAADRSLQEIICQVFASLNSEQIVARLKAAKIAHARVNTMADVWEHPQLIKRQRWVTVDSPAGALPALLPPGSPSTFTARMDAVPALGEHTDSVLQELGYQNADIQALRATGTI
jgi:itaconate CoA-transferase